MKNRIATGNPQDVGFHNADLAKSMSRIHNAGTWKKQRIVVIMPSAELIPLRIYLAHRNLMFPPNQAHLWLPAEGTEVGQAYSDIIQQVLASPELSRWEYILTLEHDNAPQPDGVLRLIAAMEAYKEYACISGAYWTKGFGGVLQAWGDPKDPSDFRPQPPDPNGGLVPCRGTGMGFALWRMSMFKDERLRRPWFKTLTGIEGQGMATQDLYFWNDAAAHGYRCAVDCSVKVGHWDQEGKFGPPKFMW